MIYIIKYDINEYVIFWVFEYVLWMFIYELYVFIVYKG